MHHPTHPTPGWSTSSMGHPADMSEQESLALGEHLSLCATLHGPLQTIARGIAWTLSMLAGHAITGLALGALLMLAGWLVW